jgi:SAM-dependent methyltransferase
MSIRSRLFARYYERSMAATEEAGLEAMRSGLLAGARGDVVEIGAGTGLNLRHYGDDVRSLTLTEPDRSMLRRLRPVARGATVVEAAADRLPLDDASADVIVSTLVLCGVGDQADTLAEIRRVLRPDGQLLLIEHVRSDDADVARRQDRMDWLQRLFAGCHCNRDTGAALGAGGFDTSELRDSRLPNAPSFVRPLIVGTAQPTRAHAT